MTFVQDLRFALRLGHAERFLIHWREQAKNRSHRF